MHCLHSLAVVRPNHAPIMLTPVKMASHRLAKGPAARVRIPETHTAPAPRLFAGFDTPLIASSLPTPMRKNPASQESMFPAARISSPTITPVAISKLALFCHPSRIRLRSTGIRIALDPSAKALPDLFLMTDAFRKSPLRWSEMISSGVLDTRPRIPDNGMG